MPDGTIHKGTTLDSERRAPRAGRPLAARTVARQRCPGGRRERAAVVTRFRRDRACSRAPAPAFADAGSPAGRGAPGPLTVYPDHARRTLFYYPPGDLAIATARQARPTCICCTRATPDPRRRAIAARRWSAASSPLRLVMNGPTLAQINDGAQGAVRLRRRRDRAAAASDPARRSPRSSTRPRRTGAPAASGEQARCFRPVTSKKRERRGARDGYWTERHLHARARGHRRATPVGRARTRRPRAERRLRVPRRRHRARSSRCRN